MQYTKKPFLGLVLKEIRFGRESIKLLLYSKQHNELRLVSKECVLELEKPSQSDARLYLYEKRKESIIRSFVEEYANVDVSKVPISRLEKDLPTITNHLLI